MKLTCELKIGVQIQRLEVKSDEELVEANQMVEATESLTKFPSWVKNGHLNQVKNLKCFELVREMLITGVSSIEVAKKIQGLGELTHCKLESIRQYLEHYKATIPTWLLASRQQPKDYLQLQAQTKETLDVMEKLVSLYKRIDERIEIGMKQERKFGLLTNGLEKNFLIASKLLEQIEALKEKLGVADHQAREALPQGMLTPQVDWNRVYSKQSVVEVMNHPEKRTRIIGVAERLLELYGSKLEPRDLPKKEFST